MHLPHKLILVFILTTVSSSVFAQIYKCKDASNKLVFTDKPCQFSGGATAIHDSTASRVIAAKEKPTVDPAPTIPPKISLAVDYLPGSIKVKLRKLLQEKRYRDLNVQLALYQATATSRPADEWDLFTAYKAFDYRSAEYSAALDAWVIATPDDYQPYLARAYHSYGMGWASRGGKWSSETSDKQFGSMSKYFYDAQQDLESALGRGAATLIPTYLGLGMWKTTGPADKEAPLVIQRAGNKDENYPVEILEQALQQSPGSYEIRAQFMRALYPRWGGSYDAMKKFSAMSQRYATQNPRIAWLEGFVEADIAFAAMNNSAYLRAEKIYSAALQFGDNPEVSINAGKNSYYQENYTQALEFLNQSIAVNPENSEAYYWRCINYRKLKDLDKALLDSNRAFLLDPFDERIQKQREYLVNDFHRSGNQYGNARDYPGAISQYDKALSIDPENQAMHYGRAWALSKVGQYQRALVAVKRSIELDPANYKSYVLLDRILIKTRDWDQIIRYWNAYIAITPDNPDAYFERSGTYHHQGDAQASFRDLKKASDLGHVQAREQYTKLMSTSSN